MPPEYKKYSYFCARGPLSLSQASTATNIINPQNMVVSFTFVRAYQSNSRESK